jgi:hypothetical protein
LISAGYWTSATTAALLAVAFLARRGLAEAPSDWPGAALFGPLVYLAMLALVFLADVWPKSRAGGEVAR